jgi:hypothetical protein
LRAVTFARRRFRAATLAYNSPLNSLAITISPNVFLIIFFQRECFSV